MKYCKTLYSFYCLFFFILKKSIKIVSKTEKKIIFFFRYNNLFILQRGLAELT